MRVRAHRLCSGAVPRPRENFPISSEPVQEARKQRPIATPALASLAICHTLGFDDGRTLSVVTDIPRKLPVIMIITAVRSEHTMFVRPQERKPSLC